MISSMFHSALQRELQAAVSENRMMRFSMETAVLAVSERGSIPAVTLGTLIGRLVENAVSAEIPVRVSNASFEPVYEDDRAAAFDTQLIQKLTSDSRLYQVVRQDERYFVQTACVMLHYTQNPIYLESFRDITALFTQRNEQFGVYQKILIAVIAVNGILIYLIAQWLVIPIRRLSRTTRRIAGGRFDQRAAISSRDEIGMLAADFNNMAAEIKYKINELEDAARRQEAFVASFAHELKTPLTSMIGYSDMLRSKEMTQEERFLAAQYIFSEGKRLESLSLKLLELIVLRKKDFEKKKISAKWLLENTAAFLAPALEGRPVTFHVIAEDAWLAAEPDLIKTLLINLLDNARKAVGEEGRIAMRGRHEGTRYVICIRDTGAGIPPEDLPRITEAFYMADKSRARKAGGAGLGLAICAEIIKLHEGTIDFRSIPGEGTEVQVCLALMA